MFKPDTTSVTTSSAADSRVHTETKTTASEDMPAAGTSVKSPGVSEAPKSHQDVLIGKYFCQTV